MGLDFDDHDGRKPTIPRRPRSSYGLKRNTSRKATIWGFMDQATAGMAAARLMAQMSLG